MKKFVIPKWMSGTCAGLAALGLLSFGLGLIWQPQRAWAAFLIGYYFWFCIALSGLFFVALQHITGAAWSATVRRVAEGFIGYIPVSLVLFMVLLFGFSDLYEWMHHPMGEKGAYLNRSFFVVRHLALYALAFFGGGWMIKNSLLQDQNGDPSLTQRNARIGGGFLLIFAFLFTAAAFDLIMSLSPHWFSTIFGVYCWSGLFFSGLAVLTLWAIFLRKSGHLDKFVNENHYHDLGKLMFAFLVFWGYVGFSQFMLIWYGNLPEETSYFLVRLQGGWKAVSVALMVVKFVLPFFFLVSRFAKRSENWLIVVALWFLGAQWLDVYWMVTPTFFETPVFGWIEIGTFFGFAGLFVFSVGQFLSRVPLVALKDPWIEVALKHQQ